MPRRLVLIEHETTPGDDRAATHLKDRGFEIEWRRPFAGDPLDTPDEEVAGAIVYGGGQCITEPERYPYLADECRWIEACMARDLPVLGLCLGGQMIAHTLGARVGPHPEGVHEFGYYPLYPVDGADGFLDGPLVVCQAHFHAFDLPAGATRLARSDHFEQQAFRYDGRTYGLQFHPEQTIEGFRRWQDADWAPFGQPGAQARATQDRLAARHDPAQHAWFTNFLDHLFAAPGGDGT